KVANAGENAVLRRAKRPAKATKRASRRERRRSVLRARQAGGHWFEPSTAHEKALHNGAFRFLSRRRCRGRANSCFGGSTSGRLVACDSRSLVLTRKPSVESDPHHAR